jgi:uncharacterized protein YkwD
VIRSIVLGAVIATATALAVPFVAGATPLPATYAHETVDAPAAVNPPAEDVTATTPAPTARPVATETTTATAAAASGTPPTTPRADPAVQPGVTDKVKVEYAFDGGPCAVAVSGSTPGAPSIVSAGGVAGTTSDDLSTFAAAFNQVRVANCLQPVPPANFRYDACMEQRLFWIAEDPSENPASAWGHIGTVRSDGVPSVGCDGNLAGGMNNTGATVAQKWWDSPDHRLSLYKPTFAGSTDGVCIHFAMTHGGVPDEPVEFARAAAYWGGC